MIAENHIVSQIRSIGAPGKQGLAKIWKMKQWGGRQADTTLEQGVGSAGAPRNQDFEGIPRY